MAKAIALNACITDEKSEPDGSTEAPLMLSFQAGACQIRIGTMVGQKWASWHEGQTHG